MHQVSRAANSITVSWPQPEQTNGNILDYQLRYYDQVGRESGHLNRTSESPQPLQLQPCKGLDLWRRARGAKNLRHQGYHKGEEGISGGKMSEWLFFPRQKMNPTPSP